jgi:hypothetical protein
VATAAHLDLLPQAAGCGGRWAAGSTSRSASAAVTGCRQQSIVVATAAQGKLVTLATKFYTKDFISLELSKLP